MTAIRILGWILVATPIVLFVYAYLVYPVLLRLYLKVRPGKPLPAAPLEDVPTISITIPAYNEERSIGDTIERLLALPYPQEKRQILIVSDASTDRTDEIVRSYAAQGVELLRMPSRTGKTAAENAAAKFLRGDIVVNMDATIHLLPDSIPNLVRVFADPTIGVASGRDRSVSTVDRDAVKAESGYVGYEMWLRDLETACGTIVGASGCFYAIRRPLVQELFPGALSRDFASPLIACENGYRSVSVPDAYCLVPRARSLDSEFNRKVRTMARGLDTLFYKRHLLSFRRYGRFAFMLWSHKLARWLVFLLLPGLPVGLGFLTAAGAEWARVALAVFLAATAVGLLGWRWPGKGEAPRILTIPAFIVASCVAGVIAWGKLIRHEENPIWEPTRRTA